MATPQTFSRENAERLFGFDTTDTFYLAKSILIWNKIKTFICDAFLEFPIQKTAHSLSVKLHARGGKNAFLALHATS